LEKKVAKQYADDEIIVKLKRTDLASRGVTVAVDPMHKSVLSRLKAKHNLMSEGLVFKDLERRKRRKRGVRGSKVRANLKLARAQADLLSVYSLKTADKDILSLCKELSLDPDVEYAEPKYIYKINMYPNDTYYSTSGSWGQDFDDLYGLKPDKLNCEAAWDIAEGEGVVVAVIDTGVDYAHQDLANNMWDDGNGNCGYDFVYNDNDPSDNLGHGTHCAGTIAAVGNNLTGIIGVASKAKIMALKGINDYGYGYNDVLAECIIFAADNGANVLSNSWGGPGESQVLKDAFQYAYDAGCISIAAAGNDNSDVSGLEPANYETVLAVSAVDNNDEKARFSNFGELVNIAAPGVDILSLRASGTDPFGDGKNIVDEYYYRSSGTSMACPHAAGVAALILSKNPALTNDEVGHILEVSCDDLGDPGKDPFYGNGRINSYKVCIGAQTKPILSISDPIKHSYIRGSVDIIGTASMQDNFQKYELHYISYDDPDNLHSIDVYDQGMPKLNELLASWDTTTCPEGDGIIALKAFDSSNNVFTYSRAVKVDNINEPPVLAPTGNIGAVIDRSTNFTFDAKDPDDPARLIDGKLLFSFDNLPSFASFDHETYTLTCLPRAGDKGIYNITYTISDGVNEVTKELKIETVYFNESRISQIPSYWNQPLSIHKDKIAWIAPDYFSSYLYDISTSELTVLSEGRGIWSLGIDLFDNRAVFSALDGSERWISRSWVKLYNADTRETTVIDNSDMRYYYLAFYNNSIVWQDLHPNNQDPINIMHYNLLNDTTTTLTTSRSNHRNMFPKIDGDIVVWQSELNDLIDICIYNLETNALEAISGNNLNRIHPSIFQNKIVYTGHDLDDQAQDIYTYSIYVYDSDTQTETRLLKIYRGQQDYADIYEDNIAYNAWYDGNIFANAYLYNISSDIEIALAEHEDDTISSPTIYQNKVIWNHIESAYTLPYGDDDDDEGDDGIYLAEIFFVPQIDEISLPEVGPGDRVTITGTNLGYPHDDSYVVFANELNAEIVDWSNREIVCIVPDGIVSGPIKVVTLGGESNSIDIEVKGAPAEVIIENPIEKSEVSGVVSIKASSTDPEQIKYFRFLVDDKFLGYSNGELAWDTREHENGLHTIMVLGYYSGTRRFDKKEISVIVKNSITPEVIIENPIENSEVSGVVTVKASSTDPEKIKYFRFFIDGKHYGWNRGELAWDTNGYENGTHSIRVLGYYSGTRRYESKEITVTVNNPIIPEVLIVNPPREGFEASGMVSIQASSTDTDSMNTFKFYVDGDYLGEGHDWVGGKWITFNSQDYENGPYQIKVMGLHSSTGKYYSKEMGVIVNNPTMPEVIIENPSEGSQVSGIVTIRASSTDPDKIKNFWFTVDGRRLGRSRGDRVWDTRGCSNGTHTIRVFGFYSGTRRYESKEITVIVNN